MRANNFELCGPCPRCGREKGRIIVRELKLKRDEKKDYTSKKNFKGDNIQSQVKHRFLIPKSETKEKPDNTVWIDFVTDLESVRKIKHMLAERYPHLRYDIQEFVSASTRVIQIFKPVKDDRYSLTLLHWFDLKSRAKEYGYRKAARDTAWTNIMGDEIRLSHVYLKRKGKEIESKAAEFFSDLVVLTKRGKIIATIIQTDTVIEKEFEKWSNFYRDAYTNNQRSSYYKYTRFYIRHHDSKIRAEQKRAFELGKRKRKADGRVQCGPFKLDELPVRGKKPF